MDSPIGWDGNGSPVMDAPAQARDLFGCTSDSFRPISELAPRIGTVEVVESSDTHEYLRTLARANGGRPPLRRIK